jgi:hypothetical protein
LNGISLEKLGCNAELIVDEFGEKLLEELDYTLVSLKVVTNGSLFYCIGLVLRDKISFSCDLLLIQAMLCVCF